MQEYKSDTKLPHFTLTHLHTSTLPHFHTLHLHTCKGQALLELAVFGGLLVFLLGVLLNYGLNYNFNQQAQMQAFRNALTDADKDVTYMYFKDRHIPDPIDPFAIGSITPITASASVTRSYLLQETPDPGIKSDLPAIKINLNGELVERKTAGWRIEGDVTVSDAEDFSIKDKYWFVYPVAVCGGFRCTESDTEGNPIKERNCSTNCSTSDSGTTRTCQCDDGGTLTCTECSISGYVRECESCSYSGTVCVPDPDNPDEEVCGPGNIDVACLSMADTTCYDLEVMDPCEGEIIDYDSCRKQCMVIVDSRDCSIGNSGNLTTVSDCACDLECRATAGPDIDDPPKHCKNLCNQTITPPWYCLSGSNGNTFVLDDIFANTYRYSMGLQPDYQKSMNNMGQGQFVTSLNRQENMNTKFPQAVDTIDNVNWQEDIKRYIVYNDNLDENGYTIVNSDGTIGSRSSTRNEITTTKGDVRQTEWVTRW